MITKTAVLAGSAATKIAESSRRLLFVIWNHSGADVFVSADGDSGVTDAAGVTMEPAVDAL